MKCTDETKEEKTLCEENYKQRGTRIRKTKAGCEPYQVKKNRPLNTSANTDTNKSHSGGEREYKQSHSPSQKRSNSSWKHDYQRTHEKYHEKYYEQKNPSQNRTRTNNNKRNNNYRTSYANKEKQKPSRWKKGGNENATPNNDHINNRKNMQESGDTGSLLDKTNIRRNVNEQIVTEYYDKEDIKYAYNDREQKDIPGNISEEGTNNKYIEIDDENSIALSLSLSNSEPEIVKEAEVSKSPVVLENIDLSIDLEHEENKDNIQIDNTESPSESGSVNTEVNNLTVEEIDIIKEMDNKRRVQGIGIMECPCSLNLDGERVGYCDAHELLEEYNETINSTVMSSEAAINNSEVSSNHTTEEIKSVDQAIDPIDEIYLTISPINLYEEIESNPPSDIEIEINDGHSSIKNENFLDEMNDFGSDTNDSCNIESLDDNAYISPSSNMTIDYVSDNYNNTDDYTDADNYDITESPNSIDVYSEDFPSPITLETSRNIDIENINALFMNLGRRQSYNSFNSSSFDSKINSSCEKTWRSMDDFSPIDLCERSRKSPSVISISSSLSDEVVIGEKDNIQYIDCEIDNSLSKSDTSLISSTLFVKSNTSRDIVSNESSYPSLHGKNLSKSVSSSCETFLTVKSSENLSINDSVTKAVKHPNVNNQDDSINVKEHSLMTVVSISNTNNNINEQNKGETNEKRKFFHSYSEDSKTEYSEEKNSHRRYSEGRSDRCRHSDEKLTVETGSKEKLYSIENENMEKLYSTENSIKDKIEQTKGNRPTRNQKKLTRTISNESSTHESSGSTSDGKDINEKTCDKQNSNDNIINDDKTAGVIMLPNSDYIAKSQESTPEKQDRSLLSNISNQQSVRRHVRFSSQTTGKIILI